MKVIEDILEALILFDSQPSAPVFKSDPQITLKNARINPSYENEESDEEGVK